MDPESGEAADRVEEIQEAVVQCLDCMHDQPHLTVEDGRVVPVEDRWERMVAGKPFVASCTVTVDQDQIETCSGPEAADSLTFGSLGESGTREFFTHVRFHKHDQERIVVHLLVELYARTEQEAIDVLEGSARGRSRSPRSPRSRARPRTPPTRRTRHSRAFRRPMARQPAVAVGEQAGDDRAPRAGRSREPRPTDGGAGR